MSKKPFIYVAGPYSSKDEDIKTQRGVDHCKYTANLLKAGYLVYSPIAETMNLALHGGLHGTDWLSWREKDLKQIEVSDEMIILLLDGWKESIGVRAEVKECMKQNKPISLFDPQTGALFDVTYDFILRQLGVKVLEELND